MSATHPSHRAFICPSYQQRRTGGRSGQPIKTALWQEPGAGSLARPAARGCRNRSLCKLSGVELCTLFGAGEPLPAVRSCRSGAGSVNLRMRHPSGANQQRWQHAHGDYDRSAEAPLSCSSKPTRCDRQQAWSEPMAGGSPSLAGWPRSIFLTKSRAQRSSARHVIPCHIGVGYNLARYASNVWLAYPFHRRRSDVGRGLADRRREFPADKLAAERNPSHEG
jgi:hypothetical protein